LFNTFSRKKLLWGALIFVIIMGIIFGLGTLVGYNIKPRPGPNGQSKVTGNPTEKQEKQAYLNIKQSNHGQARGKIQLTPKGGEYDELHSPGDYFNSTITASNGDISQKTTLATGWSGTGSIMGEVATTIIDKRTGNELWSGTSPLSGSATATVDAGGNLNLDVSFDNSQTFAVDFPDPTPKLNHILLGGSYHPDDNKFAVSGSYQRDVMLYQGKRFDLMAVGRIDTDIWPDPEVTNIFVGLGTDF
jgi:hypothetical protein